MLTITIEFDALLAPLLRRASAREAGRVRRVLAAQTTLKDAVEALGIPHGEVGGAVAADGRAVGLDDLVAEGGRYTVRGAGRLVLPAYRFLADTPLGALVRLLRLAGFDTAWARDASPAEVARRGLHEDRIVLSGSRALLMRRVLGPSILIRDDHPDTQAAAVLRRCGLADAMRPFGRCPRCNGPVAPVDKTAVAERIPPRTAAWLDAYTACADCGSLYWEGTHVARLRPRLEAIAAAARGGA